MVPLVNSAFRAVVQGVDPRTGYDDTEGGRLFLMQIRNLCELDPSDRESCRAVAADHVFFTSQPDEQLARPVCCFLGSDRGDGTYAIEGKIPKKGRFTAMIGYEWTSTDKGNNLHRNVFYRDGAEVARQMLPYTTAESFNPEDLWKWMARYGEKTGGRVMAAAHNGNLSTGTTRCTSSSSIRCSTRPRS